MNGLSRHASKCLAVALLFVVFASVAALGLSISAAYRSNASAIAEQRLVLGRMQQIAALAEEAERAAAALAVEPAHAWFLKGEGETLIAAQMQQKLQAVVVGHQASFLRAAEIKPRAADGLTTLGVRIEITGTIESTARVLQEIETGIPFLFVERAQLNAEGNAMPDPSTAPLIQSSFDVVGILGEHPVPHAQAMAAQQ